MRFIATLCVFLLGSAVGVAQESAQQSASLDGFSICPLKDSEIGACAPLTDAAIQGHRLTAKEADIVRQLRLYAAAPKDALLDELEKSFTPQRTAAVSNNFADFWFPDRMASGEPNLGCFICGIHLRVSDNTLQQINYAVNGRFIVIWSRVMTAKP